MDDLLEALNLFSKYMKDPESYGYKFPLHCEHDTLTFCGVSPDQVSDVDKARLDDLGFFVDDDLECFQSYRFGSA